MSPEGGFNYGSIKAIRQDTNGFIWLCMGNDLYRFDGYQYINYNNHFKNIVGESTLKIFNGIETDAWGHLYVVIDYKLYVYRENSDTFERLSDMDVYCIKTDSQNNIWVISSSEALFLFHPEDKCFTSIDRNHYPIQRDPQLIWSIDGQVYWIVGNTVYTVSEKSGIVSTYGVLPSNNYTFAQIHGDGLWLLHNWEILYKVDFRTLVTKNTYDLFSSSGTVRSLHIDKYNYVWIGSDAGLYILNPETGAHILYQHAKSDPFSLPNSSIWAINIDRQENVWISTHSGGLCYVNLDEKSSFRSYTVENSSLNHEVVCGFAEDKQSIWIATNGKGINLMDKKTGNFSLFPIKFDHQSTYDNVNCIIVEQHRPKVWVSKPWNGLYCYDGRDKKVSHFKSGKENSLQYDYIKKMVLEPDSGLWIIYQITGKIVSFYSFKKKTFDHIEVDTAEWDNSIADIYRDTTGHDLWITMRTNLYRMNLKNRNIHKTPVDMVSGRVITMDRNRNVWIGTRHGLIRYSTIDSTSCVFDGIMEFNSPSIQSIYADTSDNLWLGTNNGLFRYDIGTDKFTRFDKDDGVSNRVFFPLSCMKGSTGELYFGGTNGFTVVTPWNLSYNTYQPKAMITDILIDQVSIFSDSTNQVRKQSKEIRKEITLHHNQVNVGFTFSSDNYLIPSKNKYRYRLKGYNDNWTEVNASARTAFYTKLPAGNYTFEVLTMNNDGLWGDTPTTLSITRLPAPWLGWQAKMIYCALFILIAYLVIRYYHRQKELKLALYKEGLEKQKREEIHHAQLQFFANISHDFRSPLSLMIATLDTIKKNGLKEYYYRILNNNSQRLLKLVNELLLFRTVEAGEVSLHLEELDVNALLANIASDFLHYAEQQQINFRIDCDPNLPDKLWIDVDMFDRMIVNLLNNAFKFTPEGDISVATYSNINDFQSDYKYSFTVGNNNDLVNPFGVVIHDTGVGISMESIGQVFERYYKIDSTEASKHLGSGIGLALVKSLVLLHKGTITIYSEREKGSDVVIRLSKDKSVYGTGKVSTGEKYQENIGLIKSYEPDLTDFDTDNTLDDKKIFAREQKRVLVVEDNEDLRHLIANYLLQHYDVKEAPNGVVALDILNNTEVDLIISDIMMPLKDGITLCNEVKNNIDTSHIPVILLTAKTSVDSKMEGVDSGADVYLEKPVNLELVFRTVRNIFKRREQLKEYYSKTYFANAGELVDNQLNNKFLKQFIAILEERLDESDLDVNYIASELSMSRSKLYLKIKSITGKTIVEFILGYRLRKAAQLITEGQLTIREIQFRVGIESPSYFTRAFKKEFGETPTSFAAKQKK